jgi:hypothetical protein
MRHVLSFAQATFAEPEGADYDRRGSVDKRFASSGSVSSPGGVEPIPSSSLSEKQYQ